MKQPTYGFGSGTNYRVTLDVSSHRQTLNPLRGVNFGVRHTQGAQTVPLDYPFDYTTLYEACGITSARLHEGGFNVSNIFRAPTREHLFQSGLSLGVHDGVGPLTDLWDDWRTSLMDGGDERGEMVFLNPTEFEDYLTVAGESPPDDTPFLYWYPSLSPYAPQLEDLWIDNNLWYDESKALEAFSALHQSEVEAYFRFGEGNYGPTFIGSPGGPERFASSPLATYAQVGTLFLQDLLDDAGGEPPACLEFWNETFTAAGLDSGEIEESFAELFSRVKDNIHDTWSEDLLVGGYGFSAGAVRDFLLDGEDSFLWQVLAHSVDTPPDFLSPGYPVVSVGRQALSRARGSVISRR